MMISKNRKSLALLLDPDKPARGVSHDQIIKDAAASHADYILAGGSLTFNPVAPLIDRIKELCNIPVILFPGNLMQITGNSDYIFFLSLISGRNPELLIGNHVVASPFLRHMRHKVIPTGYMLIGTGSKTSVMYMSNTEPIPSDKIDIAVATAIAGELLGMKAIYLEAGSGAVSPVPTALITAVKKSIEIPLIVGGGLRTPEVIAKAYDAGADMIVTGNGTEENSSLLGEACKIRDSLNS